MDQFPITGARNFFPGDPLEPENPLLLNPYEDNDKELKKHFEFRAEGIIEGKTERGRRTVSICNLNREELRIACLREFKKIKKSLIMELVFGGSFKGQAGISDFTLNNRYAGICHTFNIIIMMVRGKPQPVGLLLEFSSYLWYFINRSIR